RSSANAMRGHASATSTPRRVASAPTTTPVRRYPRTSGIVPSRVIVCRRNTRVDLVVIREFGGPRNAVEERKRQEREAVRVAQGQRHVQAARRPDSQLAERLEEGRAEERFRIVAEAGRHHGPEEGSRSQGR